MPEQQAMPWQFGLKRQCDDVPRGSAIMIEPRQSRVNVQPTANLLATKDRLASPGLDILSGERRARDKQGENKEFLDKLTCDTA